MLNRKSILAILLAGAALTACQQGKGDATKDSAATDTAAATRPAAEEAAPAIDTAVLKADVEKIIAKLYSFNQSFYYDSEKPLFQKYGTKDLYEAIDGNIRKARAQLNNRDKNIVTGTPASLLVGDIMDDFELGTDGSEEYKYKGYNVSDIKIGDGGKTATATVVARSHLVENYDWETGNEYNPPKVAEKLKQTVILHFVNESDNPAEPDWKIDDIEMHGHGMLKPKLQQNKLYYPSFAS